VRRLPHRGMVVAMALLPTPLFASTFDQGPVATRPYRNQALATAQPHPVETENLFGFTFGSDVDEAGTFGVALESVGAFGRREGRYRAAMSKLEFSYAPVDNLSVSLNLLAGAWDVDNSPDLPHTYAWRFRGIGGEMRWRLLERGPERFGVTLHVEPSMAMFDEAAGQAGTSYASENKLIVDTVLVHDRVWAAMNLVYDVESFRPWAGGPTEEASVAGVAGAVTSRVFNSLFLGAELRQLYAFNGLTFGSQTGKALYLGPTAYWRISNSAWLTAVWNIQIAGHANDDPRRLDLANFSRHAVRLKIGVEF
jgi:hypothetical protein